MRFPKIIFRSIVSCLLITAATALSFGQKTGVIQTSNDFKQLAGAADEIYQMRLPDPAAAGLRSKAAMLPIRGGRQTFEIPVESAENFRVMILAKDARNLALKIVTPNGERFDPRAENLLIERTETTYGIGSEQFPAEVFSFKNVSAGVLKFEIDAPASASKTNSAVGYLVASSNSPYRLYSYVDSLQTIKNRSISLVATLADETAETETALAAAITRAEVEIAAPSGKIVRVAMYDDGNHGDELADDGIFGGAFIPRESGKYLAQVTSRGTTPGGEQFVRTNEHLFEVAETAAAFGGNSFVRQTDETSYKIVLPIEGMRSGQKVIAHAEVWGRDAAGRESAIAWIGGMTILERNISGRNSAAAVALNLDARWLVRAGDFSDYELRGVRLQSAETSVILGTSDRISLPEIKPSESLKTNYFGEITDEMRMGKRPVKETTDAVGGKLMLVHGYCSGDAWGSAAQFSNYVKFLDLNKNRTHDQFANLIKNFGANLPSFGIVAHSQGGAASLHLYTYYWSGLDYATDGARLIQSVGTPYQGTALAGNLAAMGQIFGAGCGSNTNLTYSGASAWLAGIPSWARAKVYYHTTSFEDVWYRYDYCNMATDPFLSDPDDGVVERAYAQLPGANNLGHKTGWCHTTGMRDPGQTTDSSRNSNMNANAAR